MISRFFSRAILTIDSFLDWGPSGGRILATMTGSAGEDRKRAVAIGTVIATLAVVAASAWFVYESATQAPAEAMANEAMAALTRARSVYAVAADEDLAAVLPAPDDTEDGDAGPFYLAALLEPDGSPKPIPIMTGTPAERLAREPLKAVYRASLMRSCDLATGPLALSDDFRSSPVLPGAECIAVYDELAGVAHGYAAAGDDRSAMEVLRRAAAFGHHLAGDVRTDNMAVGSAVLARSAERLARIYEKMGDEDLTTRAMRVSRNAELRSRMARPVALGLRRAALTPEGARFVAEEIGRLQVPAWRAEAIYALGTGWCYNLSERRGGPVPARAEALGDIAGGDMPVDAAVAKIAAEALGADAKALAAAVEKAVR